jgi:hypothetical protein
MLTLVFGSASDALIGALLLLKHRIPVLVWLVQLQKGTGAKT